MFSPLIHSTTNYAKRKAIPRLFEPIRSRNQSAFQGVPSCQKCGLNSHCAELIDVTFYCRECAESERNAKQERKTECQSAGHTSISVNPSQSSFSPPEFKVGDMVECMTFGQWRDAATWHQEQYGKIGSILWIGEHRGDIAAELTGCEWYWPLRALRHAELMPQEADGWNLHTCTSNIPRVMKSWSRGIGVLACLFYDGHWEGMGTAKYYSWHELKRALEEAK